LPIIEYEPDLTMDPARYYVSYFKKQTEEEKEKKFILSLSFPLRKEVEGGQKTYTCTSVTSCLDIDFGPESVEDETNLRLIFSALHEPLFNQNKALFKNESFRQLTPAEYTDYVTAEDPSLILKLLFSIATGSMEPDREQLERSKHYRSKFMAVAVAKDMLQNITLGRPAPFQLMLAQQLQQYGVKSGLVAYLSSIRLSASISHLRDLALAAQEETAEMRVATDPLENNN